MTDNQESTPSAVEEKILNYCRPHVHMMWAASIVSIILDCDFKDAKTELDRHDNRESTLPSTEKEKAALDLVRRIADEGWWGRENDPSGLVEILDEHKTEADRIMSLPSKPLSPSPTKPMEGFYRKALEQIWEVTRKHGTKDEWISSMMSIAHDALMVGNVAKDPKLCKEIVDSIRMEQSKVTLSTETESVEAADLKVNWEKWEAERDRDQTVMTETLGRLCEKLKLDCSCCYGAEDCVRLIADKIAEIEAARNECERQFQEQVSEASRHLNTIDDLKAEVNRLRGALERSANQLEGMALCLKTHGTNLNVPWLIETYMKEANLAREALGGDKT